MRNILGLHGLNAFSFENRLWGLDFNDALPAGVSGSYADSLSSLGVQNSAFATSFLPTFRAASLTLQGSSAPYAATTSALVNDHIITTGSDIKTAITPATGFGSTALPQSFATSAFSAEAASLTNLRAGGATFHSGAAAQSSPPADFQNVAQPLDLAQTHSVGNNALAAAQLNLATASSTDAHVGSQSSSLVVGTDPNFTMTIGSPAIGPTGGNSIADALTAAGADLGKLQNGLAEIYEESQLSVLSLTGADRASALDSFHSVNDAAQVVDGMVAIDAVANNGDGAALLTQLESLGLQSGASYGSMAGGLISLDALGALSDASLLAFARPVYAVTEVGPGSGLVVSQDVQATNGDVLQADGYTGAGIRIGILSDSFDTSSSTDHYLQDQATGDLPAGINIVEDHAGGTDEGRGMAQLAYDMAPGANFDFYTADTSMADFAKGIVTLSQMGDKVIVDDVRYFAEPMFQDGILAQAEETAYANGAMTFSSAGNYDQRAYDSAFRDSGQTVTVGGVTYELHDFDPGAGVTTKQSVSQAGSVDYILQWDQSFFSLGGAGATSDLAMFFYSGSTLIGVADSSHDGGDPIEIAGFTGSGTLSVSIGVKQGDPLPGEIKYAMIGGDSVVNTFATNSATMFGHANSAHTIAVGAAGYDDTPAFGQSPPLGEWFTSKGGQPILFDDSGHRLATPEIRPGVAFTSADGGNTTFFSSDDSADADTFPNFYGTSAAAPNAAAIAALLMQADPNATRDQIREAMADSAIDITQIDSDINARSPNVTSGAGTDAWTGTGLIQADQAVTNLNNITTSVNGQLWYVTSNSLTPPQLVGSINSNGSGQVTHVSTPQGGGGVDGAYYADVAVDSAAGYYWVVDAATDSSNHTSTDPTACSLVEYRISDNTVVQSVVIGDHTDEDEVQALAVDTTNHYIYVAQWGADLAHSGIERISYNPATGAMGAAGTFVVSGIGPNAASEVSDVRSISLDTANHRVFYSADDNGYGALGFSPSNAVYVADLNSNTGAIQLTSSTQFPTGPAYPGGGGQQGSTDPNGLIGAVAYDSVDGLVYFLTSEYSSPANAGGGTQPDQDALWYVSANGGADQTATKVGNVTLTFPGESAALSFDPVTKTLYISDQAQGGNGVPSQVVVAKLDATGHSATSTTTLSMQTLTGDPSADYYNIIVGSTFLSLPVLTLTSANSTAQEGGSAVAPLSGVTITDADSGYLNGATVKITGGTFASNENSSSDDHLSVSAGTLTGTNITASYDAASETLTLSGYDTIADYEAALAAVQYTSTGDNPTNYGQNTSRTLTWTVSDGETGIPAGQQNQGTTSIAINAINDAPVNTITGTTAATEDTAIAVTGVSISDADANPINSATGSMTVTLSVSHGTLSFTNGGLGIGITGNNTNTLTLTGDQNDIDGRIAASGLIYKASANYNGNDTLHIVTSDNGATGSGGAQTDTDDKAITVASVNDAPVTANNAVTTLEDTSYTFQASDFPFSDPNDSPANSVQAVKIVSLPWAGSITDNGVAVTVGSFVPVADITSGKLVFTPAANGNGSGYASFQFAVQDDGGTANGGVNTSATHTMTLNVTAVNDAPVASVPGAQSGTEDTALVFSGAHGNAISVSDVDANGGNETVTLGVTHGTLTLSTETNLTVTGDDSGSVTLTGTLADINTALDGLSYQGDLNYNGADTLTINVNDNGNSGSGGALSDQKTVGITLAPDGYIDGNAGDNDLTGTPGPDFFRLQQGGNDSAHGLGGNDTFYFGGAMTSADNVDGGPGTDQLALQGDYATTPLTLGAGVVSVESLYLMAGDDARLGDLAGNHYSYDITTDDANVAAGQQLTVDGSELRIGENLTFDGSAETDGSFFIYAGAGIDTLTGGAKNDVFVFNQGDFGPSDTVHGGGGLDQLALRGNTTITFGANQLDSIESLYLVSAHDQRIAGGGTAFSYDLTMDDGNLAAGQQMVVDGAALHSNETLTLDASAETNGTYKVFGGAGNDTLIGGHGADTLYGDGGADTLTGNGGNDIFFYRSVADSTPTASDTITDFTTGDLIELSQIDADTGTPGTQAFTFIGANGFSGHAGELQAVNTSGSDWTIKADTDGDGVADLQILLHVADNHTITGTDFHL